MMDRTTRVDAIWDAYRLQRQILSPKLGSNRVELHDADKIPIPKGAQWQLFLKDSQNKDELFQFISWELQRITVNSQYHLLTRKADIALGSKPTYLSDMSPCRQEETDTRMMLHLRHAADQGHTKSYLTKVD